MLQSRPTHDRIIDRFDDMPSQLQQAARYILDHPREVALISMRELAAKAGVQPSTMTRLAKFLGFEGYNVIRDDHAEAIRRDDEGFAARARATGRETATQDEGVLARNMIEGLSRSILRLTEGDSLRQLSQAAHRMMKARRIYVLGLRSCHSVAWHFHYVVGLLGDKAVLLDGVANTAGDGLIWASDEDVLLVASVNPYVAQTIEMTTRARAKGLGIIAITDSAVSPLVSLSDNTIFCQTESSSFFHTLTPALAVSEVLCALIADADRDAAIKALHGTDQHLLSSKTYVHAPPRRAF